MRSEGSTRSRREMRSAATSDTPSGMSYSASTIFWKVRYSAGGQAGGQALQEQL
jgi:hypothetical protein